MAFAPLSGSNSVSVSATASSVAGSLPLATGSAGATQLLITNTSATLYVSVAFAASGASATLNSGVTLAPYGMKVVTPPIGTLSVAAIGSGAGPTVVTFVLGEGI
jgi:hypothetical protein